MRPSREERLIIPYYALTLAILTKMTPEQAFWYLESDGSAKKANNTITKLDTKDMIKLKETMTYAKIGEIYNITAGSVYNRIRRHQGRI